MRKFKRTRSLIAAVLVLLSCLNFSLMESEPALAQEAQNDAGSGRDAGGWYDTAVEVAAGSYTGYMDPAYDDDIVGPEDYDFYKIFVNAGQTIGIIMEPPAGSDFELYLNDPNYEEVAGSLLPGDQRESVSYTAVESGYHYFFIYRSSGGGSYSFEIRFTTQNDAGSGRDAGEYYGGALEISAGRHTGHLDEFDTEDWYKIYLSAGEPLLVDFAPDTPNQFYIWLWDNKVNLIQRGAPYPIVYTAEESGYHYIRFSRYAGSGDYIFEAWKGVLRGPIFINDNADFTAQNGVVAGTGTRDDPYIIENWVIMNAEGDGIAIRNTTAYFTIRNCLVRNSFSSGISLGEVEWGQVLNCIAENNYEGISVWNSDANFIDVNTCLNNTDAGIRVWNSSFIFIVGNTCSNNRYGIYLSNSPNCRSMSNTCSNNTYGIYLISSNSELSLDECTNNRYGIYLLGSSYNTLELSVCSRNSYGVYLSSSHNNTVRDSDFRFNSESGIFLEFSSGNVLERNVCGRNGCGIRLWTSSHNTLISNQCFYNDGAGIKLTDFSNNNIITKNLVYKNGYGFNLLFNSKNNILYHNFAHSNTEKNAACDEANKWENEALGEGNWWGDWQPPENASDNNNDGVLDQPYMIGWEIGRPIGEEQQIQDNYPLALVTLQSPTDGARTSDSTPTLRWSRPFLAQPPGIPVPALSTYRVQVGNRDFSNLVEDATVKEGQHTTSSLSWGTYWWRVKGIVPYEYETPWSLGWKFTIFIGIPEEIIDVRSPPVYISVIMPTAPVSITLENTDVENVEIEVVAPVENVGLTVQQFTELPPQVTIEPLGITYKMFNFVLENITSADIHDMRIIFKVKRSWIEEKNIDEDSVTLYGYDPHAETWENLPTEKVRVGDEYIHYSAATRGLSLFAVSGGTKPPTPVDPKLIAGILAIVAVICALTVLFLKRRGRR